FLLVGAAAQLDSALGSNSAIREATIFFFMGNELLSLLENAGRMGIPLPEALTNTIDILVIRTQKTNSEYDNKKGDVQ
ncbi:phage holin family protein, partial [Bacillus sp. SS-TM]